MTDFQDSNDDDDFREAAQAIFAGFDPAAQRRIERLGRMTAHYVGTPRDNDLRVAFDMIIENAASELFGKAGKRRALFVIGESGSGKTTAVEKHISLRPQFQKRVTSDGDTICPIVPFEGPKPLTLKGLAKTGLKALGHEVSNRSMTEYDLFDLWKHMIREKKVLFIHIDEMQHIVKKGTKAADLQAVADVIKSLLQIPGWPLHVILSGVPALARFLHQEGETERQLKNRSIIVELKKITYPRDYKAMRKVLLGILEQGELDHENIATEEFIERQIRASDGAFGSMIQVMRSACELTVRQDQKTVTPSHFAAVYAMFSGCRPSQNIFDVDDWRSIVPDNSLAEMLANQKEQDDTRGDTKPNRRKKGD